MLILAMDTASAACQSCVYDSDADRVLALSCETIGRGHAERLMPVIDAALEAAAVDLSGIARIAVTVGPGSFTGIRVGVAAARGLALGLGRVCVGVGSLQALAAAAATPGPVLALIDARRGQVYAGLFEAGLQVGPPAVMTPQEAADLAGMAGARLTGSGAPLVAALVPEPGATVLAVSDAVDMTVVSRIAAAGADPADPPKPLYLRGADARPQEGFAVARKV